jgi:hypothetical protein
VNCSHYYRQPDASCKSFVIRTISTNGTAYCIVNRDCNRVLAFSNYIIFRCIEQLNNTSTGNYLQVGKQFRYYSLFRMSKVLKILKEIDVGRSKQYFGRFLSLYWQVHSILFDSNKWTQTIRMRQKYC